MNRPIFLLLTALVPLGAFAQTQDAPMAPPPPPVALQGVYNNRVANAQADQWRAQNSAQPGNAQLQLNWFRSEYNARSSDNNGTLKPADKVALNNIANDIKASAPGSFEQHLSDYFLEFPQPAAFTDLQAAYAMDPAREELLAPMVSKAMLNGDATEVKRMAAELDRRNAIAAPLSSVAADLLLSVGRNGILFTNGDMDTQPAVVLQALNTNRPDVLIVDKRLLANSGYRSRIWQSIGASGSVPGNGVGFAKALIKATDRPVCFALSLDRAWLDAFPGQLHAVGLAFRVGKDSPSDAAELAKNWNSMKKPLDAGPLSRNYLLPGVLLLTHYRNAGETAKAADMETELRRIANATGAMGELQQAGILSR